MKKKSSENKHTPQADEISKAIDYGIDVSMLIDNLKRTPAERIRRHQIALNTVEKLKKAKFV